MNIDVERIAKLAMLEFTPDQIQELEKEFEGILTLIENLPDLSGDKIELNEENIMQLRKDEVLPSLPRQALLENVPHSIAGCVVVPKTLD